MTALYVCFAVVNEVIETLFNLNLSVRMCLLFNSIVLGYKSFFFIRLVRIYTNTINKYSIKYINNTQPNVQTKTTPKCRSRVRSRSIIMNSWMCILIIQYSCINVTSMTIYRKPLLNSMKSVRPFRKSNDTNLIRM